MARTGRPKTGLIAVECARPQCGEQIQKYPSEVARSKTGRFFCSPHCRNQVGSKPKTGKHVPCEHCGKDMWVKPSEEGRKRFCTRVCKDAAWMVGTETRTCEGCGEEFEFNLKMEKWNAGRFCTRDCMHEWRRESAIGTRKTNKQGYVLVYQPDHPNAQPSTGWVYEHRLVMSEHLGRALLPEETPHHKFGDRSDNSIGNLELWSSSQPPGQRVDDKVDWAIEFLRLYRPDVLKEPEVKRKRLRRMS